MPLPIWSKKWTLQSRMQLFYTNLPQIDAPQPFLLCVTKILSRCFQNQFAFDAWKCQICEAKVFDELIIKNLDYSMNSACLVNFFVRCQRKMFLENAWCIACFQQCFFLAAFFQQCNYLWLHPLHIHLLKQKWCHYAFKFIKTSSLSYATWSVARTVVVSTMW